MAMMRIWAMLLALLLTTGGMISGLLAVDQTKYPGPVAETTAAETTAAETTVAETTAAETKAAETTAAETTAAETTAAETTAAETTAAETTEPETTEPATQEPETEPATQEPETEPATQEPETEPATQEPETEPATQEPETEPVTEEPETETETETEEETTEEAITGEEYEDELVTFRYDSSVTEVTRGIDADPTAPQKSVAYDLEGILLLVAQSDYAPKALLEKLGNPELTDNSTDSEQEYAAEDGGLVRITHVNGVYLAVYLKDADNAAAKLIYRTAQLKSGVMLENLQTVISSLR